MKTTTPTRGHTHIRRLIPAYAQGQLAPAQQRRVLRHVQACADCRAALEQERRLADDLRTFMPRVGQPAAGRLKALYPHIWAQSTRRTRSAWLWRLTALPAYGMAVTVLLIACVLIGSALFVGPSRAVASPMSPADVKATWTPIFTGEPTRVAANTDNPAIEASLTAAAEAQALLDRALPVSPVPVASVAAK